MKCYTKAQRGFITGLSAGGERGCWRVVCLADRERKTLSNTKPQGAAVVTTSPIRYEYLLSILLLCSQLKFGICYRGFRKVFSVSFSSCYIERLSCGNLDFVLLFLISLVECFLVVNFDLVLLSVSVVD